MQYAKQLEISIEKVYDEKGSVNAQKDIQNLLSEYANRQEIGEIRFIDKDQIIIATTKQSNRSLINQKRMIVLSKSTITRTIKRSFNFKRLWRW